MQERRCQSPKLVLQQPSPERQTPVQGKEKQKAGAKAGGQEDGDAWEAAPEKLLRLRVKDVRNTLKERWLQLFWPEDGRWWPGQVLDIRCKERKIRLLYKTGACPSAYSCARNLFTVLGKWPRLSVLSVETSR